MSIDLSHPLVPSIGQHDPLDGFVTYNELQATVAKDSEKSTARDLRAEILDMASIFEGKSWTMDNPLGIGGLSFDGCRAVQLIVSGNLEQASLLETLLESSLIGLDSFVKENSLKLPAEYCPAFRELGLSTGLRDVEKMRKLIEQKSGFLREKDSLHSLLKSVSRHAELREIIEKFWLEGANREAGSWITHHDINRVMLATSLASGGFLEL